jgi:hypothetical protein
MVLGKSTIALVGMWLLCASVLCAGTTFNPKDPVYEKVKVKWTKSQLDVTIPPEMDCFAKCGNVDLCQFGKNMLMCFDENHDKQIDMEEMGQALGQLSFLERPFAGSPKKWVDIFDGSDGSKKDQKVGFFEVLFSEGHCTDFYLGQGVFFKQCLRNLQNSSK